MITREKSKYTTGKKPPSSSDGTGGSLGKIGRGDPIKRKLLALNKKKHALDLMVSKLKTTEVSDEGQGTEARVTRMILSSPPPASVLLPSYKWRISSASLRHSLASVPWMILQGTTVGLEWCGSGPSYPGLHDRSISVTSWRSRRARLAGSVPST